jgi:hypothetical protein
MSPQTWQAILGVIRGAAFVAIVAILTYLGDASHLQGILNPETASFVAVAALAVEHWVEGKGKGALFGAVRSR